MLFNETNSNSTKELNGPIISQKGGKHVAPASSQLRAKSFQRHLARNPVDIRLAGLRSVLRVWLDLSL